VRCSRRGVTPCEQRGLQVAACWRIERTLLICRKGRLRDLRTKDSGSSEPAERKTCSFTCPRSREPPLTSCTKGRRSISPKAAVRRDHVPKAFARPADLNGSNTESGRDGGAVRPRRRSF